jgi:origin recognition complex subunit 4
MMNKPDSTSAADWTMNLLSYTLQNIFSDKKFIEILNSLMDADSTTSNILRFL